MVPLEKHQFRIKSKSRWLSVPGIYKQYFKEISDIFNADDHNQSISSYSQLLSMSWTLKNSTFWPRYTDADTNNNKHCLWKHHTLQIFLVTAYLQVTLQTHIPLTVPKTTVCYQFLPCAGCAARSIVCSSFTAKPVAIQIGRGMVDCESLLVALAHFGEDINPVLGLYTIICLDI